MNKVDNAFEYKKKIFLILSVCICILIAVLSSMPSVQQKISGLLTKENRTILAKITGYFGIHQKEFFVLKIKDATGLQIEIYDGATDSGSTLKQKFLLMQDSDAYITLDKETTNLALSDVDKDGLFDILAPSVDQNGNLRLNIFRYNEGYNSFEPYVQNN